MSGILGAAALRVEQAMQFRVARQSVLASNLANVDTPNYRRADLHFEVALGEAASRARGTSSGHRAGGVGPGGEWRLSTQRAARGPDGNAVDSDREVVEMSRNAGAFVQQAEVLARLFALTRTAIEGRGA